MMAIIDDTEKIIRCGSTDGLDLACCKISYGNLRYDDGYYYQPWE
jgi:hypothetical protein